jgi:hypothetical protein
VTAADGAGVSSCFGSGLAHAGGGARGEDGVLLAGGAAGATAGVASGTVLAAAAFISACMVSLSWSSALSVVPVFFLFLAFFDLAALVIGRSGV